MKLTRKLTVKRAKDKQIHLLELQLKPLVRAAIAARRFIHHFSPPIDAMDKVLGDLDKSLARAGASAKYSDKELAGLPCRDPGYGGCMGGKCETCAARARLKGRQFCVSRGGLCPAGCVHKAGKTACGAIE